ncbi:hypothetical protein B0H16DRAFT_177121 [Mycena metata]|uniref:Uncharacterized protein n=1 Tax=Mycena metata TaxID=1033252 RepID=A0AAD7I2G3_9AGAR|nr:hypothetical protein B0H16DRAFT_177121 [Mycena metata]
MTTPISRRLVAVRLWKLRSTFCIGIPLPGHTQHDFTGFLSCSLLVVTRNTCFSHPRNFELFCGAGGIQRRRANAVGPVLVDAIMAEISHPYPTLSQTPSAGLVGSFPHSCPISGAARYASSRSVRNRRGERMRLRWQLDSGTERHRHGHRGLR